MSPQASRQLIEKAVAKFVTEAGRGVREAPPLHPRVITISRQYGSGGRRIAEALGRRLPWPLWDKEILDVVASQSHVGYQARMFDALDETSQSAVDALVSSWLGGISKHVYLYLLPRAILIIAQRDAIILGRGAHLLLPQSLRVRIVASLETRVQNLVRFEGLSPATARARARTSDQEREAFLRELASHLRSGRQRREDQAEYDLTINTDKIGVEEAADLILVAADKLLSPASQRVGETASPGRGEG